jgi:hypothetical protein
MLGQLRLRPLRSWSVKFREAGRHPPHGTGARSFGFAESYQLCAEKGAGISKKILASLAETPEGKASLASQK